MQSAKCKCPCKRSAQPAPATSQRLSFVYPGVAVWPASIQNWWATSQVRRVVFGFIQEVPRLDPASPIQAACELLQRVSICVKPRRSGLLPRTPHAAAMPACDAMTHTMVGAAALYTACLAAMATTASARAMAESEHQEAGAGAWYVCTHWLHLQAAPHLHLGLLLCPVRALRHGVCPHPIRATSACCGVCVCVCVCVCVWQR